VKDALNSQPFRDLNGHRSIVDPAYLHDAADYYREWFATDEAGRYKPMR
jgi:hypothetical protein